MFVSFWLVVLFAATLSGGRALVDAMRRGLVAALVQLTLSRKNMRPRRAGTVAARAD